jgi:hypothetical protein
MRCSPLVDWPAYPRLAHTMLTATAQAQSGVEEPEVVKAAKRVEVRGARRGDQCGADERQSRALAGLPSA